MKRGKRRVTDQALRAAHLEREMILKHIREKRQMWDAVEKSNPPGLKATQLLDQLAREIEINQHCGVM